MKKIINTLFYPNLTIYMYEDDTKLFEYYEATPTQIRICWCKIIKNSKGMLLDYIKSNIEGPAVEFFNGTKEWWIDGTKINCNSQEEFERILKMKVFL